jgi:hypothetical protein
VTRILAVGHSHVLAMQQAMVRNLRSFSTGRPDMDIDFVRLFRVPPGETEERFGIGAELRAQIGSGNYELIVSSVGGNGHNAFGLANHMVPYDFVLPEEPELPLSDDAPIVPVAIVRKALREQNEHAFIALREIRKAAGTRVIHVESPPPMPDDHIVRHPGYFQEMVARHGVAPARLRHKLWRLNSCQFRDFCAASAIDFLPSPPEFRDAQGMLVETARTATPTHANGDYGAGILFQIAALVPATIAS